MKIKACLTKQSDEWETPKYIYNQFMKLNYHDPCPKNGSNGLEKE